MYENTQPENYWYTAVYDELIWAVVYPLQDDSSFILFLDENGFIFESLDYSSWERTTEAMVINGFTRYVDDKAKHQLTPPVPPFKETDTLNELMAFFKESWIEPTLKDGVTPKTILDKDIDFSGFHSPDTQGSPSYFEKALPKLKYSFWALALILSAVGYAYFTEPSEIVVTTDGKIEGNLNNVRAFVQQDRFWKTQLAFVNKSIALNQALLSEKTNETTFDRANDSNDEDEFLSVSDLIAITESTNLPEVVGDYYDEIKNNPEIEALRTKAKQLHLEADALDRKANQIAISIFMKLSAQKALANLKTIKAHIEKELRSL